MNEWPTSSRIMLGAALGTLPGGCLFAFDVAPRIVVLNLVSGAVLGSTLGMVRVGPLMLLELLVRYAVASTTHGAVGFLGDEDRFRTRFRTFLQWLMGTGENSRGRLLVAVAALIGAGSTLCWIFVERTLDAKGHPPLLSATVAHSTHACVGWTLAAAVWCAATVGFVASPFFRRPLLFAVPLVLFLLSLVMAGDDPRQPRFKADLPLFVASYVAGLAVFWGLLTSWIMANAGEDE